MDYDATVQYLFTRLPMYQRVGAAAYKKDLTNTIALLQALQNPHTQYTSIHVGGTNGKGSVSNMLASICQEAGYQVGLYTSPHLEDFRERIRVNGVMCEESFVVDFVERMRPAIEEIEPSFFEITVAMAFDYFAQKNVDIAIVEVGLGGRLDSTNVITPAVSVITNISYDHMAMLGNTLPEIAFEKAGIIKPDTPVVIGEYTHETLPVFEQKAARVSAPLYPACENIDIRVLMAAHDVLELDISCLGQLTYPSLKCTLTGQYQLKNIATVIQTIEVMRNVHIDIPEDAVYDGMLRVRQNTGFRGRWEILAQKPLIVADCAHNSGGLALLFEQVKQTPHHNLHIVTGAVQDKDIEAALSLFPMDAVYYFCRPDIPRGLDAKALQTMAARTNRRGLSYQSVEEALYAAMDKLAENDFLLICGSIFVVAEALPAFRRRQNDQ